MLNQSLGEFSSERMPVLFIGHGSPMNAIATNAYTMALAKMGQELPRPRAILVISAHWMTDGTFITEMSRPKTIHDFYGFPRELYDIQYAAPGDPQIARMIRDSVDAPTIQPDLEVWGLDHGTWSVLRHLYPKADIPVLQLSLNMKQGSQWHFEMGEKLAPLREQGILIMGSGNLVHNLSTMRWTPNAKPYAWAIEFDDWLKTKLQDKDFTSLINKFHETESGRLSVPSMEHYFPLYYVLGASNHMDELTFEYEEIQNGSISMRSFSFR